MAKPRVVVKGYRETERAFRNISKELNQELRQTFAQAAEPVAAAARQRIGSYQGASVTTIQPVALARGVVVRQSARKVTGQRPDFGGLQMRHLLGALDEHEQEVIDAVEDALDDLSREEGF